MKRLFKVENGVLYRWHRRYQDYSLHELRVRLEAEGIYSQVGINSEFTGLVPAVSIQGKLYPVIGPGVLTPVADLETPQCIVPLVLGKTEPEKEYLSVTGEPVREVDGIIYYHGYKIVPNDTTYDVVFTDIEEFIFGKGKTGLPNRVRKSMNNTLQDILSIDRKGLTKEEAVKVCNYLHHSREKLFQIWSNHE